MGSNFSGPGQSRHAAFGIAHQPCSWPQLGGNRSFEQHSEDYPAVRKISTEHDKSVFADTRGIEGQFLPVVKC
jgi:hypothetical protein